MKEPLDPPVTAFRCSFWRADLVTMLWCVAAFTLIFNVIFLSMALTQLYESPST